MSKQALYVLMKNEFLNQNPNATPEQIEAFCKELAKELGL